jgi:DedD protein
LADGIRARNHKGTVVLLAQDDKEKKMAQPATDEQQRKERAMRRLALALGLTAIAIAGLALLDRYSGGAPANGAHAPSTEPPAIAALPPPKPIAPPPLVAPEAAAPPPPPSVDEEQPGANRTAPATAADSSAPGIRPRAAGADAQPGPARSAPPPPMPAAAPDSVRLPSTPGYVVQLGMFSSVDNAQALLERLKAQGVPAYLETRVVVGPFRDRAEADAAQRKLQAGGVLGVIAQRK